MHVLQHELVDARLRGELAPAQHCQALVRGDAAREPAGDAGRDEAADREQPRLHEAVDRRIVAEHPVGLLEQQRDGGERRIEIAQAPGGDDRRADERDHQHHAQAAAHPAARVHEQRDREHVDAGVQRQLDIEQLAQPAQRHMEQDREAEIGTAGDAEQLERVRAEVERILVDERQREEQRRYCDAVEVEVAERDPERVGRALGRREEELRVAQRRLHHRGPGPRIGPSLACSSEQ